MKTVLSYFRTVFQMATLEMPLVSSSSNASIMVAIIPAEGRSPPQDLQSSKAARRIADDFNADISYTGEHMGKQSYTRLQRKQEKKSSARKPNSASPRREFY